MKPAIGKQQKLAVSTGQAARYCFVTSDTIVNWIKAGLLAAQRTAGGQYRILVNDLRSFMRSRGMSTQLLDGPQPTRPHCWEFLSRKGHDADKACAECVVRHLAALNCFKLMGMRPGEGHPYADCEDCPYFKRWAETE